jgi:hypothetical protein
MEDVKFVGGYRFGGSLSRIRMRFSPSRTTGKKIDWGLTYYRSTVPDYQGYL